VRFRLIQIGTWVGVTSPLNAARDHVLQRIVQSLIGLSSPHQGIVAKKVVNQTPQIRTYG